MATNNAINLKSSGIVSYDAAGAFTALANPLIVSNGGMGVASNTAYAVLCGGTTGTGAIQSIASVGTSTHVLTSNGAGALPTFQAAPAGTSGFSWVFQAAAGNPADSTNYYISYTNIAFTTIVDATYTTFAYVNAEVPKACTIKAVYGVFLVGGTLGSASNCTLAIRVNATTDNTITSTLQLTAASNAVSVSGLSISLSAGDRFNLKFTGPAWATNPTTVTAAITVYAE